MTPGADVLGVGRAGGAGVLSALRAGGAGDPRMTEVAVGTVREARETGMSINDVPMYEIILDVAPTEEPSFIASIRRLVRPVDAPAMVPGAVLPVRFDPARRDAIDLADMHDPTVAEAFLRWRVAKGLLHPDLVDARLHGTRVPASVLAVRPTGRRAHRQVELEVDLLIPPAQGRPSREATTLVFVYPQALSLVQVGSPVTALYRPARPEVVAMTLEPVAEGAS
ncbi:hypothetical protein ACT3TZ_01295 [Brachybacterium sp. AOP25-B2-12]|uniref:hypothetical protein n=1 Tax=Brachybacterium sp. AOP25-B2-12 TaxID=3457710 RepID=UPI0040349881